MKNILLTISLLAILGTTGCKKEEKTSNKPVVKIGVSLPLTGGLANVGQDIKKAFELSLSEIPSESNYKYDIIFEDDTFQARKELSNSKKLIYVDGVDVLISYAGGAGIAISKEARDKKIIHFDFTWGNEIVESSDYTFNMFTQPCDMTNKLLERVNRLGYKTISIIGINHKGVMHSIACLKKNLKKYPEMEIIDEQIVNYSEKDFSLLVQKMESKKPDIYFSELYSPTLEIWGKTLKEKNSGTPISSTTGLGYSTNLEMFEGAWFVGDAHPSSEYMEKFKNKYGKYPNVPSSVVGYEIANIIKNIYEKYENKPNPEKIKNELLSIKDYNTYIGKISVDQEGRFKSAPSIKIIENGKVEILEE